MGRGTAILRYGSALHSRRLPGPSTQRLFRWLEAQLDMRGVDPAVYSRYLISLLQLDDSEFERSEVSDQESDAGSNEAGSSRRPASRRSRRKRQQQQQQQQQHPSSSQPPDCVTEAAIGLASGVSSRKRAAAMRCLRSACNDPYELDELIDELCYRLKRLNTGSAGILPLQQLDSAPCRLPVLAEEPQAAADASTEASGLQCGAGDALLLTDSGQAGTPEEDVAPVAAASGGSDDDEAPIGASKPDAGTGPTEDYVCAFPALGQLGQLGQQQRERRDSGPGGRTSSVQAGRSAWARGPPRSLHRLPSTQQQQQHQSGSLRRQCNQRRQMRPHLAADEGFLDGDEIGVDADDEDGASVTSEGSEILQLVSHILHSFNRELEDELAAASAGPSGGPAASACDELNDIPLLPPMLLLLDEGGSGGVLQSGDTPAGHCDLLTPMPMMEDEAELLSDHDFDNLPSQEEEIPQLALLDFEDDFPDSESVDSALTSGTSASKPASAVAMATGVVALPADLVLERMAQWTALDRLRCQMWSRKPLPPKPEKQKTAELKQAKQRQQPQAPVHRHPMTPLEKSKRACSFLLRGRCKKEDCEFAHDLNRVICKFWSAGECFKGDTCPFLHGSPAESETD